MKIYGLSKRINYRIDDAFETRNLPSLSWSFGRIVDVHPSEVKVIRVVIVKTINDTYKRSIKKIVILPIETLN
jgi:hypothetical protein